MIDNPLWDHPQHIYDANGEAVAPSAVIAAEGTRSMGTRWRGVLAPINQPTGDGRRMAVGAFTHRPLPLPLRWQRAETQGHDDASVVGVIDTLHIDDEAGHVWGEGEMFDDVNPATNPKLSEDVKEAMFLLGKKAIGPSVDPGHASAVAVIAGTDDEVNDEKLFELMMAGVTEMPPTEMLFTAYEIAGATLVPVPAFAECRPFELAAGTPAITASKVRTSGWGSMPIAPRDRAWDADAAKRRIAADCGLDGDSPDWGCYASAFLYQYTDRDPQTRGAYAFPIVDHIDGEHQIVPAAVFAAANILSGGRGGTDIPAAKQAEMRRVVGRLYKRLAEEFDDPSIQAPWGDSPQAETTRSSGEYARMALLAAAQLGMPPEGLFADPGLDRITPLTRRPLGDGWVHVFGHVAEHQTCLVGMRNVCVTPPYSEREYSSFHRYHRSTDGSVEFPLPVGRLTAGFGSLEGTCRCCPGNDDHACANISFGAAVAHHDRMQVLAYGRSGEDEKNNAIWFSGIEAPGVDERGRALLNRQKISGDWREVAGSMELSEILVLNRRNPGFPLPRVSMEGGRQRALTAAGVIQSPMERQMLTVPKEADPPPLDYQRLGAAVAEALMAAASGPAQQAVQASVRGGWDDIPLAPDGREWDKGAAVRRLVDWADGDIPGKYARAFIWRDPDGDPNLQGTYKLPVADVVDGRLVVVPNAVRAVASRLEQTQGLSVDDVKRVRSILDGLFDRIHEQAGTAALDVDDELALSPNQRCGQVPDAPPVPQGMVLTAAEAHTGAMLALRMTEEDAARLCVTDGLPMEELHLTLAYLGSADEIPPEVREKIEAEGRELAASLQPVTGDGFAVNVFNPGTVNDRETALVLGVGGAELADIHRMIGEMNLGGHKMPEQHSPFVPHVTLQYTDDLDRVKAMVDRVGPVTFDRLRMAFGGDVVDVPLGGLPTIGQGYDLVGEMSTRARAAAAKLALSQIQAY